MESLSTTWLLLVCQTPAQCSAATLVVVMLRLRDSDWWGGGLVERAKNIINTVSPLVFNPDMVDFTPSGWSADICRLPKMRKRHSRHAVRRWKPTSTDFGSQHGPSTFMLDGGEAAVRSPETSHSYLHWRHRRLPGGVSAGELFDHRPWYPRVSGRRRSQSPPPPPHLKRALIKSLIS